jgi:hypothetical protein
MKENPCVKFRWEFLRRDPKVIDAFRKLEKLKGDPGASEAEKAFCEQIGMNAPFPDISKPYEQVTQDPAKFFWAIQNKGVSWEYAVSSTNDIPTELTIKIDLTQIKSVASTLRTIEAVLVRHVAEWFPLWKDAYKTPVKTYQTILDVGSTLQESGQTYESIAADFFPEEYDSRDEKVVRRLIKKVRDIKKSYDALIHGGWKKIS